MKNIFISLIVILFLFSTKPSFGINISINDANITYTKESGKPFIDINKRTQVPLRITMEKYGASVDWDPNSNAAIVQKDGMIVKVPIGEDYILSNGQRIQIDSPALIKEGRTYLPIRAVLESFGAKVEWDPLFNKVMITSIEKVDKNIYTIEYLEDLVKKVECDASILEFRNKDNSRRKGLLKSEGKYFDMYYPNDDYGKSAAEFLTPHMDKVYTMLADMYGLQAELEVHLIHEKDAFSLKEGDIRDKEKVTFIWLEPNNDDGGNNLAEFVHEINHNFFSESNGGATNIMWLNEANAKLIASLYIKYNYDGKVDQWSFYEDLGPTLTQFTTDYKDTLSVDRVNKILRLQRAWGKADGEKKVAQIYGMHLWSTIYNTSTLDEFKNIVTNLGTGDVVDKLEELLELTSQEITEIVNKTIY